MLLWLFSCSLLPPPGDPPPPFEPAVWFAGDSAPFQKSPAAVTSGLGEISDLARFGGEMVVAGTHGYAVLDLSAGALLRSGPLQGAPDNYLDTRILDLDGDGTWELLRPAMHWVGPTTAYDETGALLWTAPEGPASVDYTVAGDADGDGTVELLQWFNARDDVRLLGHDGRERWTQTWGHPNGAVLLPGTAAPFVVIDGTAVQRRDIAGNLLYSAAPPGGGYVNALHLVHQVPGAPDPVLLVGSHGESAQGHYLLDPEGLALVRATSWDEVAPLLDDSSALVVGDRELRLRAQLLRKQAWPAGFAQSALEVRVYEGGTMIFEEIIPSPPGQVWSGGISRAVDGAWWVAFGDRIWRYEPVP